MIKSNMQNGMTIWNWRMVVPVFAFYTILSMFFLPRLIFMDNLPEQAYMLLFFALANYMWVGLTLFVFYLGEKFPVSYPFHIENLFFHFLFSLAVAAVFVPIYIIVTNIINFGFEPEVFRRMPAAFVINTLANSFMYYTGSLAAHQAVFYSQKFREREWQLQQAELQILKMQIHPHFFFNTLNAISALMYRSPKDADRMIIQLSEMFRIALKKDKAQEVTLREELDFLKAFLQIHQTLMGKRLTVEYKIAPETLDALVPNLILQPLAENSIQHGLSPLEDGGRIEISSFRSNGHLELQVWDSGRGVVVEKSRKGGGV